MIEFIWHDLLYLPLYNLLIFFYAISPGKDMGLAVIFLTLFFRVVLLPFSLRSARSENKLERLKPLIDEIQQRYRHDLDKQRQALRQLLRKNKISVFANVGSLAFQLLVLVVLYSIFSSGLQLVGKNELYAFMPDPGVIDPHFLGGLNLIVPNNTASIVTAVVVFIQQIVKHYRRLNDTSGVERAVIFGMPIGTYLAVVILPSAKALFITTSVIFSIWMKIVQFITLKYVVKDEKLKQTIDDLWKS